MACIIALMAANILFYGFAIQNIIFKTIKKILWTAGNRFKQNDNAVLQKTTIR
jgi:hypothetical protein